MCTRTGFSNVCVCEWVCEKNEFHLMTLIWNRDKDFWHKLNTIATKQTTISKLNDLIDKWFGFYWFGQFKTVINYLLYLCVYDWRMHEWAVRRNGKNWLIWFNHVIHRQTKTFFAFLILINTVLNYFRFDGLLLRKLTLTYKSAT